MPEAPGPRQRGRRRRSAGSRGKRASMRPPRGTITRRWASRPGTPLGTTLTGPARSAARAPAGRVELLVQRLALPGHEHAPGRHERQAQLHQLGEARHRAGGHRRPRLAVARVAGEGLRARRAPRRPAAPGPSRRRPSAGSAPSCRRSPPAARGPAAEGRGERQARETRRPTRCPAAASMPSAASGGTAASESRTWRRATSAGSRMAVRLIASVQASRNRTWASIAARAAGARTRPSATRPASSVSWYAAGSGARSSKRVGSGPLGRSRAPSMWSCTSPSGSRSRRRTFAAAGVYAVWRHPVGSGPGLPGAPCGWRAPSAHAACGDRTVGPARRGVKTTCPRFGRAPPVRCG